MSFPPEALAVLPKRDPREEGKLVAAYTASRALPEGVVVVTDPPPDYPSVSTEFRSALAKAGKGELQVKPGCALSVLAVGPLLTPFAWVGVRRLECHGKRIELELGYSARPPRKPREEETEGWRPLAIVPLLLRVGSYHLEVKWQQVDKARDGKPLPVPPLVQTCSFVAPEGLVESPARRVHQADFQILVDGRCPLPKQGERRSLQLALRMSNRSDKELLFWPSSVTLRRDSLRSCDGSLLRFNGGKDHEILDKPVRVAAGHSHLFLLRGEVGWFNDAHGNDTGSWYAGGQGLFLTGVGGSGDTFWYYDGLTVGRYRLCLDYHAVDSSAPTWTGRVRTEDAEFEMVP